MAATDFRAVAGTVEDQYDLETDIPDMPSEQYGFQDFAAAFEDDAYQDVTVARMGYTETATEGFLATEGLASCIGVAAYDAEEQYGCVSHVVSGDAVDGRVPHLEDALDNHRGDEMEVTYVVGNCPDDDVFEDVVRTVRESDADVSEEFVYTGRSGSVALDLATGTRYTFDSDDDPHVDSLLP
ncbi:MAG: hypothetical protein SVU32_06715 [Candidatus Nanohaloarchaea archaeon]|nr:hypothetical protein [Candidatus Nanohaloarchaea archaeon]